MQKLYNWTTFFSMITAAVMALGVLFFLKLLPWQLPLFYSLPWGERQLANQSQFLIIPASIVLITLINLVVSHELHASQSFLKIALSLSSLITTSILIIAILKIIFIFL